MNAGYIRNRVTKFQDKQNKVLKILVNNSMQVGKALTNLKTEGIYMFQGDGRALS